MSNSRRLFILNMIYFGYQSLFYTKKADTFVSFIFYSDFLIIFNHKSCNNWSSISDGDQNIGSRYFWFLGNAITSRIFSFHVNTITILSNQNAHHPWGGTQNVKHFSIWPNLNWISFSSNQRMVNIACWSFWSWILILHHQISYHVHTIS